jgi:hypothetical protein
MFDGRGSCLSVVALGLLTAATYLWPESRVTAYTEKPRFRREEDTELVNTSGRG